MNDTTFDQPTLGGDEESLPKKVWSLQERTAMAREALAAYVLNGGNEIEEAWINICKFFKLPAGTVGEEVS